MKNIEQLISMQSKVFEDLASGSIDRLDAKELTNAAGKIINAARVKLEYNALIDAHPKMKRIKFLESKGD